MAHVGEKVEEPTDAFCVADAQQWLAWRHATLRHLAADGGGHASVGALMRSTARMKSRSESGATHAARLNSARGGAPPGRHVPSVKLGSPDTRRSLLSGAEGGTTSGLTLTHREVLASGT